MRIDAGNLQRASELQTVERNEARSQTREAEAAAGNDTANLASGQNRVRSLAAAVNQYPEVRQQKVIALAEKVRSGTYDANPRQTAEALMSAMAMQPAA